jgi:hypothetical protein
MNEPLVMFALGSTALGLVIGSVVCALAGL